jgi:hypothetical protein
VQPQIPEQAERAGLEHLKQLARKLLEQGLKEQEPRMRELLRQQKELTLNLQLEIKETEKTS